MFYGASPIAEETLKTAQAIFINQEAPHNFADIFQRLEGFENIFRQVERTDRLFDISIQEPREVEAMAGL
jgi:hypothetical protein